LRPAPLNDPVRKFSWVFLTIYFLRKVIMQDIANKLIKYLKIEDVTINIRTNTGPKLQQGNHPGEQGLKYCEYNISGLSDYRTHISKLASLKLAYLRHDLLIPVEAVDEGDMIRLNIRLNINDAYLEEFRTKLNLFLLEEL